MRNLFKNLPAVKKVAIVSAAVLLLAGGIILYFSLSGHKAKNNLASVSSALNNNSTSPADIIPEISPEDQITDGGQIIPLLWTDDNSGENLIIKTDKKYYDASSQVTVYFSVANTTQSDQKTDIYFWFDGADKKVESVEKIIDSQISNVKFFTLSGVEGPNPNFPNRKSINGYTNGSQFKDTISANQINYYKATVKSPPPAGGQQSEFFIEAIGDKNGYGHLDPYIAGGLVGYWSFNGSDINGTTAYDRSGSSPANNGILTGANGLPKPVIGISGQALSFDGVDDYVATPSIPYISTFSFSFWIKTTTTVNNAPVFSWGWCRYAVVNSSAFPSPNKIFFATGGDTAVVSSVSVNDGKWHHVGYFYRGSSHSLYVDGVLQDSQSTSLVGESGSIYMGSQNGGGAPYYAGLIDEVRIYNRALSADEISQLYRTDGARAKINTPLSGRFKDSSLMGYWSFNGQDTSWTSATAGTTNDLSGNNNTGTMTNMSRSASPVPGISGQALSFDGVNDYMNTASTMNFGGTKIITVSFWLKQNSYTNTDLLAMELSSNYNNNDGTFLIDPNTSTPSGVFEVCIQDGAGVGGRYRSETFTRPSTGVWHHYGIIFDNSTVTGDITVYVDGIAQTTIIGLNDKDQSNNFKTDTLYFMSRGGTTLFNAGLIDEVRVYNRALTATEIAEQYRAGAARMKVNTPITGYGSQSGLVGNWSFNGQDTNWTSATAGTTNDLSGQGNTGTMTNMSRVTSPAIGVSGSALSFDGVDDYVIVVDMLPHSVTEISFAFWLKTTADSSSNNPFVMGWSYANCHIGYWSAHKISCTNDGSTYDGAVSQTSIDDNKWHFIVFTSASDNTEKIYVDGVYENSGSALLSIANSYEVIWGKAPFEATPYYSGLIDEGRIYNRALSASEVLELYNVGTRKAKMTR